MKNIALILSFICAASLSAQTVTVRSLAINTDSDDFGAAFTQNGKVIFFSSERDADNSARQKIYTSSGFGRPDEVSDMLNAGRNNGAVTLTPDGQYMIFAAYQRNDNLGRTDLYSAEKVGGEWKNIRNLGPNVNSDAWDSQPSLSSDGMTLYFSSDRGGGQGGADIYISRREKSGWSKAVSAGSAINSGADDMSPNIAPDNATFYFASNRSGGQGGFDIYSSKLTRNSFSRPLAMAEPVNSSSDEYFYTALPNSTTAYFSSNRSGGSGELDIYSAEPNPVPPAPVRVVTGFVRDVQNSSPLGTTVYVTDLKTNKRVAELHSDDLTGEYYVTLTSGRQYAITASRPGYLFYSERFEVPETMTGSEIKYDISLSPVTQGRTRLLVFFDYDKADLQEESTSDLDRVVEFLQANSPINVEIQGHTDDQGTVEYNSRLSERRAEAVKNYLVKAGIAAKRVTAKGFGKSQPLVNDNTEEARAQNRRVEMLIK